MAGPDYAAVNPHWLQDGEPSLLGVPWACAEVIDLDTGKRLKYGGQQAEVIECSSKEGWAVVQDHYTKEGKAHLEAHGELLKVRVQGRFEIRESN